MVMPNASFALLIACVLQSGGVAAQENRESTHLGKFDALCASLSPITIHWTRNRQSGDPEQMLVDLGRPSADRSFLLPMEVTYSLQEKLVRSSTRQYRTVFDAAGKFRRTEEDEITVSFNGEKLFIWSGEREENKMLNIQYATALASDSADGKLIPSTILNLLGISLPCTPPQILEGCLSYFKRVIAAGGNVNTRTEGRELLISATDIDGNVELFRCDAESPTQVRSYSRRNALGQLLVSASMSPYISDAPNEAAFPETITVQRFQFQDGAIRSQDEGPFFTETYDLKILNRMRMEESHFTISERVPGTLVSDSTVKGIEGGKSGQINYVVPPDVASLDAVIAAAMDSTNNQPTPAKWFSWSAAVAAFICGAAIWRMSKKMPVDNEQH